MATPLTPLGYQNPNTSNATLDSETVVDASVIGTPVLDTVRERIAAPSVESVLQDILEEMRAIRKLLEDHI